MGQYLQVTGNTFHITFNILKKRQLTLFRHNFSLLYKTKSKIKYFLKYAESILTPRLFCLTVKYFSCAFFHRSPETRLGKQRWKKLIFWYFQPK